MAEYEKYVTIKAKDLERLLDDSEYCMRLDQFGIDYWPGTEDIRSEGYGYSEDKDYWEFCSLSLLDKCDIADVEVYELYG